MARDIPIGNGNILVAFDKNYTLREFYFPHVGEEDHANNNLFRFGVWVSGSFSWVPKGWKIKMDYLDDSLVTNVELRNEKSELLITANDFVDFHENIYFKKLTVHNLSHKDKEVRIFLQQNFDILGNDIGDTAAFRPETNSLLHYKGERYFLINIFANKKFGIDSFATGNKNHQNREGTWKDAEDGILSGNPIAQGSVDSVVCIPMRLKPDEVDTCFYWICAGKNWNEVSALNTLITKRSPEVFLKRTLDYWALWVDKEELNYDLLPAKIVRLYKRSLLIARTQIDNGGSIIAANDSDAVLYNRDTYSYMWPRDGAMAAYALDLAGYSEITCRFFNLCGKIIEKEGYFLHKYTPSGMLASSWMPWQKDKKRQLPIQEDETALVVWALWNHYKIFRDIEFIKPLYRPLIKNAANFMMNYRDNETKLPLPSYDLWEERQGILAFTASAVYGGLIAASNFTEMFGETELSKDYRQGAMDMRGAMDKYLYLEKEGRFARMINLKKDSQTEIDSSLDSSLFGVFAFGAYEANDSRVKSTMQQMREKLWCKTDMGGLARYENDAYYRKDAELPGNPWFITTLWLAQYYIAAAGDKNGLDMALPIFEWACDHALPSCVLAEQVDPHTDEPLSVSPLTWSHATYIAAVLEYFNKLLEMEKCTACNQWKYSKRRPAKIQQSGK